MQPAEEKIRGKADAQLQCFRDVHRIESEVMGSSKLGAEHPRHARREPTPLGEISYPGREGGGRDDSHRACETSVLR